MVNQMARGFLLDDVLLGARVHLLLGFHHLRQVANEGRKGTQIERIGDIENLM